MSEPEKAERVITLRIGRDLHNSLKEAAKASGDSLNQFCAKLLRQAVPETKSETGDSALQQQFES